MREDDNPQTPATTSTRHLITTPVTPSALDIKIRPTTSRDASSRWRNETAGHFPLAPTPSANFVPSHTPPSHVSPSLILLKLANSPSPFRKCTESTVEAFPRSPTHRHHPSPTSAAYSVPNFLHHVRPNLQASLPREPSPGHPGRRVSAHPLYHLGACPTALRLII